ncbi:hypothetical protein B878_13970 [Vibrio campbellii CAIM 519 = NBRC 15631 = ATCC 25920]|nr:hypothetical protein B878_13970 [Vibrio campbellii CAIM 519 = NBRC 15631 = ATCC 25920]
MIDKYSATPFNYAGKFWIQIFFVILALKGASIRDYAAEWWQVSISALGLIYQAQFTGDREGSGNRPRVFNK